MTQTLEKSSSWPQLKMNLRESAPPPSYTLTERDLGELKQQGYLAIPDLLTPEEVEKSREALKDLIRFYANQVRDGETLLNPKLWVQCEPESGLKVELGNPFYDLPEEERELKVRKVFYFVDSHPWMHYLVGHHPRLRGILESILGANPILFQDMALIKPPWIGSEKPWHQDNAYFSVTPLESIIGIWIALDPATKANGCMHVIPGGHHMGPLCHRHTSDCELREGRVDPSRAVAVELPPGGAMFFYGMLPHQTPPNSSPDRRRALQFHYRGANTRIVDEETYNKIYCEPNGTPASCASAAPKK